MSKEFEYYRMTRKNDNTIPLLDQDTGCPIYLSKKVPIEKPELMLFRFGKPVPKNPKMADYHSSPDSIISKRIADILAPMNIEGIQLIPALIKGKNDELFTEYYALHIYNRIKCVDPQKSDCTIKTFMLDDVKKIVLDKNILADIPLEKRLIFRLKEDSSYQLCHFSIVEKIMSARPEGVRFTNIEEWSEGSFFDN